MHSLRLEDHYSEGLQTKAKELLGPDLIFSCVQRLMVLGDSSQLTVTEKKTFERSSKTYQSTSVNYATVNIDVVRDRQRSNLTKYHISPKCVIISGTNTGRIEVDHIAYR